MTTAIAPRVVVTPAQRQQLDDLGYFMTDVLFDEETLAAVRGEFYKFWAEWAAAARKGGDPVAIEQAEYRAFVSQLDLKGPACNAFCRHPVMLDLCRQLLGPDADMTWNQMICKKPQHGAKLDNAFGWHQDMWYATHGDYIKDIVPEIFYPIETGITVWAAISRTFVDNGTLWVLPGRHKEGLLPHVWNDVKREWSGQFDTSWRIPAVMKPGQVLVFRKYLPHGSGENVSNEDRLAYQIGYGLPGMKTAPTPDITPVLRGGEAV